MAHYKVHIIFFMLGWFCLPATGQDTAPEVDPILIRLKARLINAGDSLPVPYANLINPRNRTGTSTNASGLFSFEMLNIDSLIVSAMGFKSLVLKVPRYYTETSTLVFYMQPVVYLIPEVKVSGDKPAVDMTGIPVGKESAVPKELRGDAYDEKPSVLAAFFNPMSYWQYYLGKKEQEKRAVREAIALEKNWEMHSRNYNKETVKMLTGLTDAEADTFMIWFNSRNILSYTSTEYQVRDAIRTWFMVYKEEKMKH